MVNVHANVILSFD